MSCGATLLFLPLRTASLATCRPSHILTYLPIKHWHHYIVFLKLCHLNGQFNSNINMMGDFTFENSLIEISAR